ncbi:nucleotidyltransferase [Rouxiella badensis]|uniref:nucleotidyltransferase n=1 Tax=Rouxiella badensis TaxID=1646377 RepID=UPI001B735D5C|nr:nucleotidyltransferase [Rouxiella badensis]MCC3747026.1 nucleotidyltransferase [Rouxiella badensis]
MATTVITAFNEFMSDVVNLEKNSTDDARSSRDWLFDRLNGFESDGSSPVNYPDIHTGFGSFARRTKIRPLDDIDLMFGLSGEGCTYTIYSDKITLDSDETPRRLNNFRHTDSLTVSSIRILNHFRNKLQNIPQYQVADIKRNQEAITLKLTSKTWNFDIVPCFITQADIYGRSYYLIPDGYGHWKKTDPRIDKKRTTDINVKNNGNVLNVIRVVKYWQTTKALPTIGSYLLETLILNYYDNKTGCQAWVDMELQNLFSYLSFYIKYSVDDHKGIQGDINHLTAEARQKISDKFNSDAIKVGEAREFERSDEHNKSINKWREIFGVRFPEFG